MDNHIFRTDLAGWMQTGAGQLLNTFPAGSGIFRIIDIPESKYQTGFVSTSAGSFKKLGESGNWYGDAMHVPFAEVRPTGMPIYEVTRFRTDIPVLDVHALPVNFQNAIYEDRDLPADSFKKSEIVLDLAKDYLPAGSYSGVYFPSRRTDGGVLTYNPKTIPVEFCYFGIKPPPAQLFG